MLRMGRRQKGSVRVLFIVLAVLMVLATTGGAGAKPPAGTEITSTVTVTWEDAAGNDDYSDQASVIIEVLPVAGVSLDAVTGATRPLQPGASLSDGGNDLHTVTLTNTGNITDTFNLDLVVDETGTSGCVASLSDPTPVVLAAGESATVQVQLTAPAAAVEGDFASVTLTAVSQFDSSVDAEDVLLAWISDTSLMVYVTAEKNGQPLTEGDAVVPGDEINYTIEIKNEGTSAASNVEFVYEIPDFVTLDEDSIVITDQDGVDISGDYTVVYDEASGTLTITGADGVLIEGGDSVIIEFDVTVDQFADPDEEVGGNTSVKYEDTSGSEATKVDDFPKFNIDEAPAVSVVIDGPDAATQVGGDQVVVTFVVTNEGNVTDDFTLAFSEDPAEAIWTLYLDAAGTQEVVGNQTGDLLPGDTISYYAITVVPGNEDGWESLVTLIATSTENVLVFDQASFTLTLSAPKMTIVLSGEAIEPTQAVPDPLTPEELVKQVPGGQVRFTITATNVGSEDAQNVVISMAIPDMTTYVPDSLLVENNPVPGFNLGNMLILADPDRIVSPSANFTPGATVSFSFVVEIDDDSEE